MCKKCKKFSFIGISHSRFGRLDSIRRFNNLIPCSFQFKHYTVFQIQRSSVYLIVISYSSCSQRFFTMFFLNSGLMSETSVQVKTSIIVRLFYRYVLCVSGVYRFVFLGWESGASMCLCGILLLLMSPDTKSHIAQCVHDLFCVEQCLQTNTLNLRIE